MLELSFRGLPQIWAKMSTMEKGSFFMHFHRNFGVTFLCSSILIHFICFFYGWYAKVDMVSLVPEWTIWLFSCLCFSLPLSAAYSFRHHLRNFALQADMGNNVDTVYSNFFVQWQILWTILLSLESLPLFLRNRYFGFIIGVLIPQIIYRRFRPRLKGGARDATKKEFNYKSSKKDLEMVKDMQEASAKWQSYGFCALKWLTVSCHIIYLWYGTSYDAPPAFVSYAREMCFLASLWQPMYPFMYTLRMKGVLSTELIYWKTWTLADHCTQLLPVCFLLSLIVKNFAYELYGPFPYWTFLAYLAIAGIGITLNLNFVKMQDYFLCGMFALICVLN